MSDPLLSIVIPSYNRAASLSALLHDFSMLDLADQALLEIIVCNNCSTDGTGALLSAYDAAGKFRLIVINRPVNLGMEGNIACSMLEGKGKYVWLLSDHQRLLPGHFPAFLRALAQTEFDIGYVQIEQWAPVLPIKNRALSWRDLTATTRGALLFTMGNISGLVYRRSFALPAAKAIFISCHSGYPHLGLISHFNDGTRFAEFETMSSFPTKTEGIPLVHEYDTVEVRYSKNLACVLQHAHTAGITFSRGGFFTGDYRVSFKRDILTVLLDPNPALSRTCRKLVRLLPYNPGAHRVLVLFVLAGLLCVPGKLRTRLAASMREHIIANNRSTPAMK